MDEYLAHLAATTGDLHGALNHPHVDTPLLNGGGGILAAMADGQEVPHPGWPNTRTPYPCCTAMPTWSTPGRPPSPCFAT